MEKFFSLQDLANWKVTDLPEHQIKVKNRDHLSQKPDDVWVRELLDAHPELSQQVDQTIQSLADNHFLLPSLHFTADKIKLDDGREVTTGFLANIMQYGLRPRDTNVGVFTDGQGQILQPSANPSAATVVKSFKQIIDRYAHHALRTNKQSLHQYQQRGRGLPVMIVIDGSLPMIKGTDYDNHYILSQGASPDKIWAVLPLLSTTSTSTDRVLHPLQQLLDICNQRATLAHSNHH